MGTLDKWMGRTPLPGPNSQQAGATNAPQASSKDILSHMLAVAEMALESGHPESAVQMYQNILKLEPNATAQYNLGSLYAQGKGVEQDFKEGAYWFHQAQLAGDEQAGKLCLKCMVDDTCQSLETKTAEQLYYRMLQFVKYVYAEQADKEMEACRNLYALAGRRRQRPADAAKLLRAAAEFGEDGASQNALAVLYNAGTGVAKNDLASLYWLDKAVDHGAPEAAQKDRDGLLNAYRNRLTPVEFYEEMMRLSGWCSLGSQDIPKDAPKARYWREMGESAIDRRQE